MDQDPLLLLALRLAVTADVAKRARAALDDAKKADRSGTTLTRAQAAVATAQRAYELAKDDWAKADRTRPAHLPEHPKPSIIDIALRPLPPSIAALIRKRKTA